MAAATGAAAAPAGDHKGKSKRSSGTSPPNSMLYAFLVFVVTLSLQQMNKKTLASSELYTILGGFISSLLFLLALTMIGNLQELLGSRTGWGAVLAAELIACVAAGAVHRVCITTCFIFSLLFVYEVNKVSLTAQQQVAVTGPDTKKKVH
ncbi:keratinocyte-associated protein 2 [Selaginella moellendorffii]|uniref:keratinocyte-associated protein 2 n=1 Tax=Selaginella moellendorffii TaxID=88036 RepID=UPI000D1CA437|nr:keratinocyte-associated protein 2 [Selaginella moellendorffii]|eukprot:XP_002986923.2 keratinocyte-associated protein 2 [Selaginella moellendorffii]